MAHQFFYSKAGRRQGPVTPEKLKELAVSGQLAPTDLVWRKGMMEWLEAQKVGLVPSKTVAAPDEPPPLPIAGTSRSAPSSTSTPASSAAKKEIKGDFKSLLTCDANEIVNHPMVRAVLDHPKVKAIIDNPKFKGILLVGTLIFLCWTLIPLVLKASADHPKLAAFRAVIAKWESIPDELDSSKAEQKWREDLDSLINRFDETPLDVKKDPDVAKKIIRLHEDRIKNWHGRYSEFYRNVLDEKMQQLVGALRDRDR